MQRAGDAAVDAIGNVHRVDGAAHVVEERRPRRLDFVLHEQPVTRVRRPARRNGSIDSTVSASVSGDDDGINGMVAVVRAVLLVVAVGKNRVQAPLVAEIGGDAAGADLTRVVWSASIVPP